MAKPIVKTKGTSPKPSVHNKVPQNIAIKKGAVKKTVVKKQARAGMPNIKNAEGKPEQNEENVYRKNLRSRQGL